MKKMRKGIIVVPGIMGSELFLAESIKDENGKDMYMKDSKLWPPSDISVEPYTPKQKLKLLYLNKKGESINNIKVYNHNFEVSAQNTKVDKYGAANNYGEMVNYFSEIYGEENAMFFSYDWRMSIEESGNLFSDFIVDFSKNKDEIYILAHSMGGLVSTFALKLLRKILNIKLITLGTPFLGSPAVFESLTNNDKFGPIFNIGIFDNKEEVVKNLTFNMSSVYDLLPTEEYCNCEKYFNAIVNKFGEEVSNNELDFLETEQFIINNFNKLLYLNSKETIKKLDILNTLNESNVCCIIGYDVKTPTKVNYYRNTDKKTEVEGDKSDEKTKIVISEKIEFGYNEDGDASVPIVSATLCNKLLENKYYFVKERHGDLVKNYDILRFIKAKIDNFEDIDLSVCGYNKSFISKKMNEEKQVITEKLTFKMPAYFTKLELLNSEGELIIELGAFREYTIKNRNITYIKTFLPNIKINFFVNINDTSLNYILRIYPKSKYDIYIDNNLIMVDSEKNPYINKFITII